MVSIFVEDNGPGLTNPGNLFVPFYTTKTNGSGVGLVLARQITEAHGGSLELRNRMDAIGCQAEVRIPIAISERGDAAENEPGASWRDSDKMKTAPSSMYTAGEKRE
jgi:nitrogen-specific signal transduction histidine kinase